MLHAMLPPGNQMDFSHVAAKLGLSWYSCAHVIDIHLNCSVVVWAEVTRAPSLDGIIHDRIRGPPATCHLPQHTMQHAHDAASLYCMPWA